MSAVLFAIALAPFYLLGAFPTGVLVARMRGVAITEQGSGNVGATNVARVMGKKFGLITLAGDVAKGAFGVWFARLCGASEVFIAAVAVVVVCGHCFSIPPYLKGGKGVATALGVIVAIKPMLASVALIAFGAVFALSKIVSLASMVAALLVPAVALTIGVSDSYAFALAVIGLTLVARHRANIQRLIDGQEPQFSFKKA